MKKLILIDDHAILLDGVATWITQNSDWTIIAQVDNVASIDAFLADFQINPADTVVAVVDLSLSSNETNNFDGFEVIKKLKKHNIKSVVFSSFDRGGYVEKALSPEVGALGFVSKAAKESVLLDAINAVAINEVFIQQQLLNRFLNVKNIRSALSPKELLVADSLDSSWNNNEKIAAKLGISKRTVENYICRLYDKTGIHNKDELIAALGRN